MLVESNELASHAQGELPIQPDRLASRLAYKSKSQCLTLLAGLMGDYSGEEGNPS